MGCCESKYNSSGQQADWMGELGVARDKPLHRLAIPGKCLLLLRVHVPPFLCCGQTNPLRVTMKIRLKIEQKCPLFLDIFSSAIMNDLFMTFTSRLKVDAKLSLIHI